MAPIRVRTFLLDQRGCEESSDQPSCTPVRVGFGFPQIRPPTHVFGFTGIRVVLQGRPGWTSAPRVWGCSMTQNNDGPDSSGVRFLVFLGTTFGNSVSEHGVYAMTLSGSVAMTHLSVAVRVAR
jgi:hypothetical protein